MPLVGCVICCYRIDFKIFPFADVTRTFYNLLSAMPPHSWLALAYLLTFFSVL